MAPRAELTQSPSGQWVWLRRRWFLWFNLAYWLVTLAAFSGFAQSLQPGLLPPAWFMASRMVSGFFFSLWLHHWVSPQSGLNGWQRFRAVVFSASVFAFLVSLALQGVTWLVSEVASRGFWNGFPLYLLSMEVRLLVWSSFYLLLLALRDLRRSELRRFDLERESLRLKIRSLNEAYNPHFLMNGLNAIVASRYDPDAVLSVTSGLADYLHYVVDREEGVEPLRRQLDALESYVALQDLRFGDALQYRQDVEVSALSHLVPRFLLQLLVENAFKHGSMQGDSALEVAVRCGYEGNCLLLQVTNSGSWKSESHDGYGLDFIRRQLKLHYGDDAHLTVFSENTRVSVSLSLPR